MRRDERWICASCRSSGLSRPAAGQPQRQATRLNQVQDLATELGRITPRHDDLLVADMPEIRPSPPRDTQGTPACAMPGEAHSSLPIGSATRRRPDSHGVFDASCSRARPQCAPAGTVWDEAPPRSVTADVRAQGRDHDAWALDTPHYYVLEANQTTRWRGCRADAGR